MLLTDAQTRTPIFRSVHHHQQQQQQHSQRELSYWKHCVECEK